MAKDTGIIMTWAEALQSKKLLKSKLIDTFGVAGMLAFFLAILLFMPGLLLIGLALIGVNIEWLNPFVWIGAIMIVMLIE